MTKRYLLMSAFILSLCFPIFAAAEVVTLKSGKTVEGKIIEKTDKYIKIDFEGVSLTYYLDEIEKVEGSSVRIPVAELERNSYVNKKYGLTMGGPRGWYMKIIEQKMGANEALVLFSKYPLESKASPNPNINLVVSDISGFSITDSKDYIEKSFQYLPSNIEIDITPTKIKINGMDGAKASVIMHSNIGTQKSLQYCVIKNQLVFTVSMVTRTGIFNEYEKDFEESLNTLSFTK